MQSAESDLRTTHVTRGKVWVRLGDCRASLRDVLFPSERMSVSNHLQWPEAETESAQCGATLRANAEMRSVVENRERELGLDRRETG